MPRASYHGHAIQLLERSHRFQKKYDEATALDSLNRTGEEIGSERLEVLEHEHSIGVTEDLLRFLVVPEGCASAQSEEQGDQRGTLGRTYIGYR